MREAYKHNDGQTITNDINAKADRVFIAHLHWSETQAVAADTDGVHAAVACTKPAIASSCIVKAISAVTDILTVTAPSSVGATANTLKINLTTAETDALAIAKVDTTKTINIALANATASNNTAAKIQVAIRALTTVGGVSVTAFTCTAGGNWDTAAIATGETAAVAFTGGQTATPDIITTGFKAMPCSRNITATAGGTANDIGAVAVVVEGTNERDEIITETLTAFTANTAATKTGNKVFKTVTKVTIPAHDGTGATTEIGFGDKLSLEYFLPYNTVIKSYLNDVSETEAPTVATSKTAIESNTIDLNSALNGSAVDVYLLV